MTAIMNNQMLKKKKKKKNSRTRSWVIYSFEGQTHPVVLVLQSQPHPSLQAVQVHFPLQVPLLSSLLPPPLYWKRKEKKNQWGKPKRQTPKGWKRGRVTLCSAPLIPPAKKSHSWWFQGLCFRGGFLVCVLKAYGSVLHSPQT